MTQFPVAIFDLDGTLIDAVQDIAAGVNRRLLERGLAPLTAAEAASFLGNGLRVFARRAFDLRQVPATETEISDCVQEYTRSAIVHTRLYPDVVETLDVLRQAGWHLAVCTNKVEAAAHAIMDQLGILHCFDVVCGGDTVARHKPDAQHLEQTISRGGFQGHPAVMIGDNRADVAAAQAYGIPCVFAGWGYGTAQMAQGAAAVAVRFRDLSALLPQALR